MRKIILVDAMNLCYRSHWVHQYLTSKDGSPTGVLYGATSTILSLRERFPDWNLAFCFDGKPTKKEGKGWRFKLRPQLYKANRKNTARKTVHQQIKPLLRILQAGGYPFLRIDALEADDLIGMACNSLTNSTSIQKVAFYSNDRDFWQLLSMSHMIRGFVPGRNGDVKIVKRVDMINEMGGREDWNWCCWRALVGDKTDNLPGLRGCGPVKARKLLSAGADPSSPWEDQPGKVRMSVTPEAWKDVEDSYRLSTIITSPFSSELSEEVRQELKASYYSFLGSVVIGKKLTPNEDTLARVASQYDMRELLIARRKFLNKKG